MVKAADTPFRNVKAEFKQWILLLTARKKKKQLKLTEQLKFSVQLFQMEC